MERLVVAVGPYAGGAAFVLLALSALVFWLLRGSSPAEARDGADFPASLVEDRMMRHPSAFDTYIPDIRIVRKHPMRRSLPGRIPLRAWTTTQLEEVLRLCCLPEAERPVWSTAGARRCLLDEIERREPGAFYRRLAGERKTSRDNGARCRSAKDLDPPSPQP